MCSGPRPLHGVLSSNCTDTAPELLFFLAQDGNDAISMPGARWMLGVASCLLWPFAAAAQERCGRESAPWVQVEFSPQLAEGLGPTFQTRVIRDLRVGLKTRRLDTCLRGEGPTRKPFADVRIVPAPDAATSQLIIVEVSVQDQGKHSQVRREVELTDLPEDGKPFAVALAVDELVGASWAQALLAEREAAKQPPAQASSEGNNLDAPVVTPKPRPIFGQRLVLRGAWEHFAEGQTHLGPELAYAKTMLPGLDLEAVGGYRGGFGVRTSLGRIESQAYSFASGLTGEVWRQQRAEIGFHVGLRVAWVELEGRAFRNVEGSTLTDVVVFARSAVIGKWRWGERYLTEAGLGFGIPIRGAEATVDGVVETGVSGGELAGFLGIGVEL